MKGLFYGVGINDADYVVVKYKMIDGKRKLIWTCPYYSRWKGLLSRCYSKKRQERHHTYKGCTVCKDWLLFSNFKKWMEQQEWKDKDLDKDFIFEGNKIYSSDTCMFLPQKLNKFIITCGKARGLYPLGVRYMNKHEDMVNERTKPYASYISSQAGKQTHLGYYLSCEEAHRVYLKAKLEQCESYLIEFKEEPLITKGLTRIKDKILFHIENNLELTSF